MTNFVKHVFSQRSDRSERSGKAIPLVEVLLVAILLVEILLVAILLVAILYVSLGLSQTISDYLGLS